MFKRVLAGFVLSIGLLSPALAEVRIDLGFNVPFGLGGLSASGAESSAEVNDFLTSHIIPFPHADVYYQMPFETWRWGAGVRIYTFILESIWWPNLYVEKDFWKMTVVGQVGGGLFGVFGLFNNVDTGQVFIPDLSLWFRAGDALRLGGGIMGFMVPEWSEDHMLAIYYLGLNVALTTH